MEFYRGTIPILDDAPAVRDTLFPKNQARGLVPRDYNLYPEPMFAQPDQMTLIPESEWDARYDEQEATKSSLEHVYLGPDLNSPAFVNLDQDGDGYCWAYSVGTALMIMRLKMGEPLVRLNPHATAAIIKKGRDEGGWCGLSAEFARDIGYAVEGNGPGQWPLHSRSLKYDTPDLRAQMSLHRITEDWVDLRKQVYDQNLTWTQNATCHFNNIPTPNDFNHWSHSVCGIRTVRIEPGSWGNLILNSWKGWGRFGLAVLRGSKAYPDGALAVRATNPSTT